MQSQNPEHCCNLLFSGTPQDDVQVGTLNVDGGMQVVGPLRDVFKSVMQLYGGQHCDVFVLGAEVKSDLAHSLLV